MLQRVISHFDEEASPVRYTEEEIYSYIDDGYDEMCERTGCAYETASLAVGADEHLVELPANCVFVLDAKDATNPDQKYPLDPLHWTRIAARDRHFWTKRGTRPSAFAGWGLDKILLDCAYAAPGTLEILFAAVPAALLASQAPIFQSEYHDGLVRYAIFRCRLKEVTAGDELGRALRSRKEFTDAVTRVLAHKEARHTNISWETVSPKRTE